MDNVDDKMAKAVLLAGFVALVAGIALGVYWCIWQLWIWVLPQIWVGGPEPFTSPAFWTFAGMWFLMTLVLKAIRGK